MLGVSCSNSCVVMLLHCITLEVHIFAHGCWVNGAFSLQHKPEHPDMEFPENSYPQLALISGLA